ncbi:MAG: hypothetical protein ABGX53_02545 [Candidatus Thioglobus sp.]
MKTIFVIVISAIVTIGSTVALAQSKVEKSIILNKSINKGNATVAIGKDNIASTGSVNIKGSKVTKSIILNKSINKGNATVAIGEGNTASTGSVTIE